MVQLRSMSASQSRPDSRGDQKTAHPSILANLSSLHCEFSSTVSRGFSELLSMLNIFAELAVSCTWTIVGSTHTSVGVGPNASRTGGIFQSNRRDSITKRWNSSETYNSSAGSNSPDRSSTRYDTCTASASRCPEQQHRQRSCPSSYQHQSRSLFRSWQCLISFWLIVYEILKMCINRTLVL